MGNPLRPASRPCAVLARGPLFVRLLLAATLGIALAGCGDASDGGACTASPCEDSPDVGAGGGVLAPGESLGSGLPVSTARAGTEPSEGSSLPGPSTGPADTSGSTRSSGTGVVEPSATASADTESGAPDTEVTIERPGDAFGNGSAGALIVESRQTINEAAARLAERGIQGSRELVVHDAGDILPGDEVLVMQMFGSGAGSIEFHWIVGRSANRLRLADPLRRDFPASQGTQLIVVPHYERVEVREGGTLEAPAWDGSTGAVLVFRTRDVLIVEEGGSIDMSARGFGGGAPGDGGRGGPGGAAGATGGVPVNPLDCNHQSRQGRPGGVATGFGGGGGGGGGWVIPIGGSQQGCNGGPGGAGGARGQAGGTGGAGRAGQGPEAGTPGGLFNSSGGGRNGTPFDRRRLQPGSGGAGGAGGDGGEGGGGGGGGGTGGFEDDSTPPEPLLGEAGWSGGRGGDGGDGGVGGAGGGLILIFAESIRAAGSIVSDGEDGGAGSEAGEGEAGGDGGVGGDGSETQRCTGDNCVTLLAGAGGGGGGGRGAGGGAGGGGGGGGAGGTIMLVSPDREFGGSLRRAEAGRAGPGHPRGAGGEGGLKGGRGGGAHAGNAGEGGDGSRGPDGANGPDAGGGAGGVVEERDRWP